MSLECVLLGLIHLHPGASGYDLNQIMNERTEYFISNSLSHIYPALKKLYKKGLVSYEVVPIKNRPGKKLYTITEAGEADFQEWLREPIDSRLDMNSFFLKVSFSPLMDKDTILDHIDREIDYRNNLARRRDEDFSTEIDFLDTSKINLEKTNLLWQSVSQVHTRIEDLRLDWLHEFRLLVEKDIKE